MADNVNQTLIYNNQVEILSTANRSSKTYQVGELVYDSEEQALYIGDLAQTQGGVLLTNANNLAVNKLDLAGGTMAGQLNMNSNAIINVPDPSEPKDAANKRYIDTAVNNLQFGLNLSLNDLNDVDSGLTPVDGDVIVYDGNTNKFIVRPQNDVDNQSLSWSGSSLTISQGNTVDMTNFTDTVDFSTINVVSANIAQANISQLNYFGPFGTLQADIKGDVYGLDSSVIIDAETPTVVLDGTVRGNIIPDQDSAYDIGDGTHKFNSITANTLNGNVTGDLTGNVTGNLVGNITATGTLDGDLTGSVFADDSSLLVDAVNGEIPGYLKISDLKSIAASSATYADFQTAIANL
jgi:glutamine cyclotransferase